MLSCVHYDNLQHYGAAFSAQFRLRHHGFIERQRYDVSCYNNMEYDQYDTPAAVYLVYMGDDGEALGCSRMTPVHHHSMLKDLWPDLVSEPEKIFKLGNWEGTRFCIDKRAPAELRQRICRELVLGYLEFGLMSGAEQIIGVMPPAILKRVFGGTGCDYSLIGPAKELAEGTTIRAASMAVSHELLMAAREYTGIHHNVIDLETTEKSQKQRVA